MRARTFRVPFSRVAPEAVELEWGPDDYLVVRPLLSKSPGELAAIHARLNDAAGKKGSETSREAVLIDVLHEVVVEWHLEGPDGSQVPMPETWAEMDTLPSGIAAELFEFIFTYRGDTPHPSDAGTPS